MSMRCLLLLALALSACGNSGSSKEPASSGKYRVRLETTKGDIVIEVDPEWAPIGAKRFRELVSSGYFEDVAFFRVLPGFVAQFGVHGDPDTTMKWLRSPIADDPVRQSNLAGWVSFASAGPNTRSVQLFINLANNTNLDGKGFPPIGRVVEGMDVVRGLYGGYGEGVNQQAAILRGNAYLRRMHPKLDYIKRARLTED